MGRFLGSTSCWSYTTLSSRTSAVISCASVSDGTHSSSLNCFEGSVLFLFQEHQLRLEEGSVPFRQVSCRPLNCENVESPKQALPLSGSCEEMIASRCSCRSPVSPGPLMGANLTCGSDAIPVMLRPCYLIAVRAALYLPPPQAIHAAAANSAPVG